MLNGECSHYSRIVRQIKLEISIFSLTFQMKEQFNLNDILCIILKFRGEICGAFFFCCKDRAGC